MITSKVMAKIIVKDRTIKTINKDGIDYICITDIAKQKNGEDPNGVIGNWRTRQTLWSRPCRC